jgi:hypothetical protein
MGRVLTHERRLEEVAAGEHLVGGRELPELAGSAPDLADAVPAGREDDEHGAGDGLRHDGPAATFGAVNGEQSQAARGGPEEQRQRQRRLRGQQREQELDHGASVAGRRERKRGRTGAGAGSSRRRGSGEASGDSDQISGENKETDGLKKPMRT